MCRYPLGGGILGDALGLEGPADGFFGGAVFLSTYSWRRLLAAWEQWRLGVRCVAMDTRRRSTLSGVVVASAAARPGKVDAAVQL